MSYDTEDIGSMVILAMRVIAFIVGLLLLFSGLVDFGRLGGMEIANVMSVGGTAVLKFIFGIFLIVAGISPEAIGMIVKVVIRG